MAKLYFRYGAVSSAKTLNLLAVAYNYRQQGKRVALIKPAIDERFGASTIRSRAGLESEADLIISSVEDLKSYDFNGLHCVIADECQFLDADSIDFLRELVYSRGIPVICYGLRTDFRTSLFDGSRRLMELADSIEEVKTTCSFCDRKAVMNLKHLDGVATVAGPQVDLGAEEKYFPACYACYKDQLSEASRNQAESVNG